MFGCFNVSVVVNRVCCLIDFNMVKWNEGMKIYLVKLLEIEKKWIVIDVEGVVVGWLVFFIVYCLWGKYKLIYMFYMDCGDNVIVVNVEKVVFIGKKWFDKIYYWYIGYLGGIK